MNHFFINVGFGNIVAIGRILSIANPDSAPAKRDIASLRSIGALKDYTKGRKTRALIYLDDGSAIASSMMPDTIATKFVGKAGKREI